MKAFVTALTLMSLANIGHGQSNIIEVIQNLGLTTLKSLLDHAGLTDVLTGTAGAPFTVFSPTNNAFDALPEDLKALLQTNTTLLQNVLEYHIIRNAKVMSSHLSNDLLFESMYPGNNIRINIYGSGLARKVLATGCELTMVDHQASNGVIHVVGKVLVPPEYNVVKFAQNNHFDNLTSLLVRVGIANTLSGGNLTVFVPTNAAFSKVPQSLMEKLLADGTKLTKVLTYHVVNGTVYSEGLSDGRKLTTTISDGQEVTITNNGGSVKVNNANMVLPDQSVTNGVIHAIDTVLLPDVGLTDAACGTRPDLLMALTLALLVFLNKL